MKPSTTMQRRRLTTGTATVITVLLMTLTSLLVSNAQASLNQSISPQAYANISGSGSAQGTVYYTTDRYHSNAAITFSYENYSGGWYYANGSLDPNASCSPVLRLSLRTAPSLTSFTNNVSFTNPANHVGPLAFSPQNISPRYFRVTRYANRGSCGTLNAYHTGLLKVWLTSGFMPPV